MPCKCSYRASRSRAAKTLALIFPSSPIIPLSSLSVKKHAVKFAVPYALQLRGHKHHVDVHLIVLRKLEVVGGRAGLFLYDQHRGFEE